MPVIDFLQTLDLRMANNPARFPPPERKPAYWIPAPGQISTERNLRRRLSETDPEPWRGPKYSVNIAEYKEGIFWPLQVCQASPIAENHVQAHERLINMYIGGVVVAGVLRDTRRIEGSDFVDYQPEGSYRVSVRTLGDAAVYVRRIG